eukprot:5220642-Pyramimonas_sp.AAC.1
MPVGLPGGPSNLLLALAMAGDSERAQADQSRLAPLPEACPAWLPRRHGAVCRPPACIRKGERPPSCD